MGPRARIRNLFRQPWWRFAALLSVVVVAVTAFTAGGASTTIVVTSEILSHSTLVTTGCPSDTAAITQFGSVIPGAPVYTSQDCTLEFGSNNDTAMLRIGQADGTGDAAVGQSGNWVQQQVTTADGNDSVSAYDANTLYMGAGWRLSASTNGGDTWVDNNAAAYYGIWMYGVAASKTVSTRAWGVGRAPYPSYAACPACTNGESIYTTTDSGTTWVKSADADLNQTGGSFRGVTSNGATTAWAVGDNGRYMKTTDGTNWIPQVLPGAATQLYSIFALDANNVYIVGNSVFFRSGDGGGSWTRFDAPTGAPNGWGYDIWVASTTVGYVAHGNDSGAIMYSNNLNAATPTWTRREVPSPFDITDVWGTSATTVYVNDIAGNLFKSIDSGVNWTRLNTVGSNHYSDITTDPAGTSLYVVGDGWTVIKSTDAGDTFVNKRFTAGAAYGIAAINGQKAIAVGSGGQLMNTSNGGTNWIARASGTTEPLYDVDDGSSTVAWAVGQRGTILKSTNSGDSWSPQTSGVTSVLYSVSAVDASTAWVVGYGGVILRTSNGGTSWNAQTSGTTLPIFSVSAVDANIAWASSMNGLILRTLNGGNTWTPTTTIDGGEYSSISAVSAQVAYTTPTYYNTMKKTINGGTAWTTTNYGSAMSPRVVDAVDENTLVVIGDWGETRRSTDGAATFTTIVHPNNFHAFSLDMLDAGTGWHGGRNFILFKASTATSIPDYAGGSLDWSNGAGMFGICLRDVTNGAVTNAFTWTKDTNLGADCEDGNTDPWRAIPQASEKVAVVPTGDYDGRAHLRFGIRAPANQTKGSYRATMRVEVIAPDL